MRSFGHDAGYVAFNDDEEDRLTKSGSSRRLDTTKFNQLISSQQEQKVEVKWSPFWKRSVPDSRGPRDYIVRRCAISPRRS